MRVRSSAILAALILSFLATPARADQWSVLTTQVPVSSTDTKPNELGLRMSTAAAGRILAVRFFKEPGDTGTHIGRIWSSTGQQLATVTFVNETASGWQAQALVTPLAMAAAASWTVSVNSVNGFHYAVTSGALAVVLKNGPLSTPANGGAYAVSGAYPRSTTSTNYFRDVVFDPYISVTPTVSPTGVVTLQTTIDTPLQYFVDGKLVTSVTSLQSVTQLDGSLPPGSHTITATVPGIATSTPVTISIAPVVPIPPTTVTSYLSDRPWTSMLNGWGPVERDMSNGETLAGDGKPLTIRGAVFPKGLGAHAASDLRYALGGTCRTFTATVGIDDETAGQGTVVFQVLVDGVKKFDSGVVTGVAAAQSVSVDLTAGQELGLIVTDSGDANSYDHADWADAKIACLPDTTAPTVVSLNPADAATGISSSTTVTAAFSKAMNAATVTSSTVTLKQGTTTVSGAVTYDFASKSLTLVPIAPLAANTVYTVAIAGGANGVKDQSGNALATDKSWSFTTAAASTVSGVPISPGQDIQSIVNSNPAGTAFVLRAGVHRMQTITPKAGDSFTGEAGTVLSGAKVLSGATGTGPWVYTGQAQEGTFNDAGGAAYQAGHDASGHPEDLFFDNVLKQHVGTLAEGVPGTWFFDYPNDTIYVFDNPAGHVVETSVTPTAISAANIAATFQSLTIEKYASLTQTAAVVLGPGAAMKSCEVRWNHYAGIETGPGATADTNFVHHNGVFGFIGSGNPLIVNNEIAYNNTVFGDSFWGAGGSKWVYANGLIVRGNFSHHNLGPGLWTDINNINVLYENNRIEDNLRAGIVHEISYDAVIRNNLIARNGTGHFYPGWPTESGIAIIDSRNVEVYGNTLTDNWGGIGALQDDRAVANPDQNNGLWEMRNFNVHDNTVNQQGAVQVGAGMTGIVGPDGMTALFSTMGNGFKNNHYALGANPNYFIWVGAINEAAWKAAGQDTTGTFQR